MKTQLTVRIPDDLDEEITNLAGKLRLKRSDIVRMALDKLVSEFHEAPEPVPYEKVKTLVGAASSGIPDLGEAHRQYLKDRLRRNA